MTTAELKKVRVTDEEVVAWRFEQLLRAGILALPEGERGEVLGITPPLTITKRQLDFCVNQLTKGL